MICPLTLDDVVALRELADKGPLACACNGWPEKCTCAAIIMLCDEWAAMKGYNPQPVSPSPQDTEEQS